MKSLMKDQMKRSLVDITKIVAGGSGLVLSLGGSVLTTILIANNYEIAPLAPIVGLVYGGLSGRLVAGPAYEMLIDAVDDLRYL